MTARPAPSAMTAPARTERDDRPARTERDDRPARTERDDRPARTERDDRPARTERDDRPARTERDDRPARTERDRDDRPARAATAEVAADPSTLTRLFVSLGKRDGVTADDLRAILGRELGDDVKRIGSVALRDSHCHVRVPEDLAERIIVSVHGTSHNGTEVRVERARA